MSISVGLVNKTTHKTTLATNISKSVMNIGTGDKPLVQINDSVVPGLGGRKAQAATLVIQAQADTDYLLTDAGTGQLPDSINVSRAGSDLWIYTDPDKDEPDIIIKDYYLYKGDILAETANGGAVIYQAESGLSADSLSSSSTVTLTQAEVAGDNFSWESGIPEVDAGWLLLGALGVGGGIALAHNSGGGSGKSGDDNNAGKAPDAPKVDYNNGRGLTGTGTAGSTVIVLDSRGKQVATTKVDKDGNWAINGANPLKEGEAGKIYAKGDNGTESAHQDITGGKQSLPDVPVITQNDEFTMTGTVGKGCSVRVIVNYAGKPVAINATVKPDGTWFIKDPLPDGALVDVIARDPAGNDSTPVSIRVGDNALPLGPSVQENGESLSGIGPENSKIIIMDANGKLIASTMSDATGKWHFASNPFAKGESGTIHVINGAGRESAKQTLTGQGDAALPSPVIDTNNSKGLSGKATPGSTITLKDAQGDVIGTTKTNEKGEWKFDKNPLGDGQKGTITASEEGSANSKSTEFDSGDHTPPKNPVITENNSTHLSGTGEPGTGIIFKDDNKKIIGKARVDEDGNWKIEPNPFTENSKGTMVGKDPAGNVTGDIAVESGVKLPPSSPEIKENSALKLSGTGDADSYILIKDKKGNLLQKVEVKADGTWVAEPNPFKSGETGTLSSTDKQGNEGAKMTVTGGHTPSKGAVLSLEADTGISDHDNITANGKIIVKEMTDAKRWEYSADGGKTWSKGSQTAFTLKDGTYDAHQVQVRYFDDNGNASQVSKFDKVIIDTVAPSAPGQTLNGGKIILTGLEKEAGWEYSVDGGKSWLKGQGDNFALAHGDYERGTIQVRQTDAAGNTSKIAGNSDDITISGKVAAPADDSTVHDFQSLSSAEGLIGKMLLMSDKQQPETNGQSDMTEDLQLLSIPGLLNAGTQGNDINTLLVSFSDEQQKEHHQETEISHDNGVLSYALYTEAMPAFVDMTDTQQLQLY